MKILNMAHDYSININGQCIPKNSLYGKIGDTYFYIDNYKQFIDKNNKVYCIYVMHKTDKRFYAMLGNRDNLFIRQIAKIVRDKKLADIVCVYPLQLGKNESGESKVQFNRRKEAQTDFVYRPSHANTKHAITDYSCSKTMNRWTSWR